jgi:hypothetical protein
MAVTWWRPVTVRIADILCRGAATRMCQAYIRRWNNRALGFGSEHYRERLMRRLAVCSGDNRLKPDATDVRTAIRQSAC